MSALCPECRKRPVVAKGLCNPCYKRLIWRPQNGSAVEHERAAARAWKAAHPDEIARLEESYQGACVDCGATTQRGHERCWPCSVERKRARYPEIERRWNAGESMNEIAAALGTTSSSLGVTMHRMRQHGFDLPHRYKTYAGKRIAA